MADSQLNAQLARAIEFDRAKRYGDAAAAYNRALIIIERSPFIDAKLNQKAIECRERAKVMRDYEGLSIFKTNLNVFKA